MTELDQEEPALSKSSGSMLTTSAWLGVALLAVMAACGSSERNSEADDPDHTTPGSGAAAPHRFDPAGIQVGDTVAGLVVTFADVGISQVDSAYVGSVRFAGELVVSGTYRALYDDPEPSLICFHVDAESAERIPRMLHDERNVWFCFENEAEAERLLGPPGTPGTATVEISDYRTVRQFTDAYDTARLLRVIERVEPG
jgi:hypothetical protein